MEPFKTCSSYSRTAPARMETRGASSGGGETRQCPSRAQQRADQQTRSPTCQKLFAFVPLHADDPALTVGAGLIVLVILERLKPILRSVEVLKFGRRPFAVNQKPTPAGR